MTPNCVRVYCKCLSLNDTVDEKSSEFLFFKTVVLESKFWKTKMRCLKWIIHCEINREDWMLYIIAEQIIRFSKKKTISHGQRKSGAKTCNYVNVNSFHLENKLATSGSPWRIDHFLNSSPNQQLSYHRLTTLTSYRLKEKYLFETTHPLCSLYPLCGRCVWKVLNVTISEYRLLFLCPVLYWIWEVLAKLFILDNVTFATHIG